MTIDMKDSNELCNSFTDDNNVILGHDYGRTVFIQPVIVKISDKIKLGDIKVIGQEISVSYDYFRRKLKPFFTDVFSLELPENEFRFSYDFADEGEYIDHFVEERNEYNFFTYDQMSQILDNIQKYVDDDGISETDSVQLNNFVEYARQIMDGSPETNLISVSS